MKKMFLALILLPLLPGLATAQGNADAGRMAWAGNQLQCRNCHGAQGQGGYAPDLAGRQLSPEQFKRAVRQPWGVMPAFVDKQISDETIADLAHVLRRPPARRRGWRATVCDCGHLAAQGQK